MVNTFAAFWTTVKTLMSFNNLLLQEKTYQTEPKGAQLQQDFWASSFAVLSVHHFQELCAFWHRTGTESNAGECPKKKSLQSKNSAFSGKKFQQSFA